MKHFGVCSSIVAALSLISLSLPCAALSTGSVAPEIGLQDLKGQKVSLAELKGKVVLVDFWASWCAPCQDELPVLDQLYKQYRAEGLVVVGVSVDRDATKMERFLRRNPVSFRVARDTGAVAERYAPSKMPSSFLIGRDGLIRYVHLGFRSSDREQIERQIRAALGAK